MGPLKHPAKISSVNVGTCFHHHCLRAVSHDFKPQHI
jgi:hypothetical protein